MIPLPARTLPARLARLTVAAAGRVVRRPAPAPPPADRAGWQEQQGRLERWFVRQGLPHFTHRYGASQGVWTRAFPVLVVLFVLQVLGLVNVVGRADGDDPGSHAGGLLGVVVPAVGLVVLLVTWVGPNLRRGRRPFARPARLGALELAAFVLVPVLPAILRHRPGDALATVLGNLVLLGVVHLGTSYGLVPLTRWTLGRLPRQAAMVGGLVTRALPLLLVVVGLLFFTAGLWQSVGSRSGPGYTLAVLLLVGLALAFLASALARGLPGLRPFGSWDEVRELVPGTPAEHLVPAWSTGPQVPAPSRRQRLDVAAVLLVTQTLQVALLSLVIGVLLLVLGVCAVPVATVQAWTGAPPHVLGELALGSASLPLTEPMLRVVGFLTAFTGLYLSVAALTDATYRRQFAEDTASRLRCALAVRAVYLAHVVPAARGEVPAGEPAPAAAGPVRSVPVVPGGLTRRALRQSGRLRPVPPPAAPTGDTEQERREVS